MGKIGASLRRVYNINYYTINGRGSVEDNLLAKGIFEKDQ